jgi:hypothetical protein
MKIFVRGRTRAQEGSRNPRFRVVAVEGGDLRFQADHMRKIDIETIAGDLGAQIVYLPEHDEKVRKEKEQEKGLKKAHKVKNKQ